MKVKIQKTVYETLPMGEYIAEIKSMNQEDGQFGPQLKFMFEIVEGDYAENHLVGWTSAKYNPKSKLWAWYHNALGTDATDEECDTDLMIGRKVRLAISVKPQDDGSERNRVEDILAMRKDPPKSTTTTHWYKVERFQKKWEALLGEQMVTDDDLDNVFGTHDFLKIPIGFDAASVELKTYLADPEAYMKEKQKA